MTEHVSVETFKIWTASQKQLQEQSLTMQEKILSHLANEISTLSSNQKDMTAGMNEIVTLLKEDIAITKSTIEHHMIQYANDREQIDIRFTNLFKRQDKIDKILIQRQSMWIVFKGFSWFVKITVTSGILATITSIIKMAFFS